jgi:TolA-binding protein
MRNLRLVFIAGIFLLCSLLPGCSNITLLRVQELKAVEAHVDTLSVQLQAAVAENQKAQNDILRAMRADLQVRFTEIEKRLSALEGSISESQDRLSKIDEKTQELKQRMVDKAKADSTAANVVTNEAENLFQIAYGDYAAGRYDLALNGFQDLAGRFTDQPRGEEAAYWIAECYYARKDGANAEKAYFNYIKSFPSGKKVCAALYKLGLVYEKIEQPKKKKMVWEKLKTQCPESEEAKAAGKN